MSSNHLTNERHRRQDSIGVSPLSTDRGSASLHESWLSGQFHTSLPPAQQSHQNRHHQQRHHQRHHQRRHNQQHHVEQPTPDWPLPTIPLAGPDALNSVPPNNTSMVTPEDTLEDVSLDGQSSSHSINQEDKQPHKSILHQKQQERLQAQYAQPAHFAPVMQLRPSSFEIMGCFTPVELEQPAGPSNSHARRHPGASQHHGTHYGISRALKPYPAAVPPPAMLSTGIRCVRVMQHPEVVAGSGAVHAYQTGTLSFAQYSGQPEPEPEPEPYSTSRLVALIIIAAITLASFLLLAQSVAVIAIFRASGQPVGHGYVVECVLSTLIFFPSLTGLVWLLVGGRFVFSYTLQSPFARRQPARLKELELGSINRPTAATNSRFAQHGEGQHHQQLPQPVLPVSRPLRGPVESRELLLQAAAPNATVGPSTTQTSIVTELCNAVSAPDSRP